MILVDTSYLVVGHVTVGLAHETIVPLLSFLPTAPERVALHFAGKRAGGVRRERR